ncbi:MAG TPA: hypothetical protein VNG12_18295 [Acidimicrobiales bacterium]|nr:hypothetical protein [Acidimicrobiales bacterium]
MSNQEKESDDPGTDPGTDDLDVDLELDSESSEAVTGGFKRFPRKP